MDDYRQPEITQIKVNNARIGLRDLKDALKEVCLKGITNEKELKRALVEEVRKRKNYIAPSAEAEYEKALVREYRRFIGETVEEEEEEGLVIRVLGQGCPNCHRLTEEVMASLAELNLEADLEHVTDINEIADYGVVGTPALIINKKVKCIGKVPRRSRIKGWLEDEMNRKESI
jgi:small redox-active disulfide protein 2